MPELPGKLGDYAGAKLSARGIEVMTETSLREATAHAVVTAVLKGRAPGPFDHSTKGAMASLGHYQGVAEVFGVRISGLVAWLLWRSFYISMLPGFSTRLRVALNGAFDYVLPRNLVQLDTREERGSYFEVVDNYKRIPDNIYPPGIRARRADGE